MNLRTFSLEFYRSFRGFRTAYKNLFKRQPYVEPLIKHYWYLLILICNLQC